MSPRAARLMLNAARRPGMTASKVMHERRLELSLRIVQRVLQDHQDIELGRLKSRPKLTPNHVSCHLEWAKKMSFVSNIRLRRMLFTDEKRFCLDGPDRHAYYWRDKRVAAPVISTRRRSGGGFMVWAGISWREKTDLVFVSGNMDAVAYTTMLEDTLLPFIANHYPHHFVFQQDNAPSHTAKHTLQFFKDTGTKVLDLALRSPHMNFIENCCEYLSPGCVRRE